MHTVILRPGLVAMCVKRVGKQRGGHFFWGGVAVLKSTVREGRAKGQGIDDSRREGEFGGLNTTINAIVRFPGLGTGN